MRSFITLFILVSVYFVMTQSGNFWIHPRSVGLIKDGYRGSWLHFTSLHFRTHRQKIHAVSVLADKKFV